MLRITVALFISLQLTACASVQPWERGILARDDMAFTPDPQAQAMQGHIYSSKEAASGGVGIGGGGCGCN